MAGSGTVLSPILVGRDGHLELAESRLADAAAGHGRTLLIAGGGFVYPAYMDTLIVYGFVAAVLGGLDSPIGAVVGGLILGVALSLVSGYLDSALVNMAALVILMVVLLVRPGGLFASSTARRA